MALILNEQGDGRYNFNSPIIFSSHIPPLLLSYLPLSKCFIDYSLPSSVIPFHWQFAWTAALQADYSIKFGCCDCYLVDLGFHSLITPSINANSIVPLWITLAVLLLVRFILSNPYYLRWYLPVCFCLLGNIL